MARKQTEAAVSRRDRRPNGTSPECGSCRFFGVKMGAESGNAADEPRPHTWLSKPTVWRSDVR